MPEGGRTESHARVLAILTLLSRILGFVREWLFAYFFGAGELLSAFRIAFVVPNIARRLFGEGALSAALIPTLTRSLRDKGEAASRDFTGTVLVRLAAVLAGIVLVGELVIALWRGVQDDPALELTAILLPYLVLICLVAAITGVLQVRDRFGVPAFVPVILNLAMIAALAIGGRSAGLDGARLMYVLCGAVLIAGVLQLALVAFALQRASFWPRLTWGGEDKRVGEVIRLMAPMLIGLSAVQFSTLADNLIAYLFITVDGERVGPAVLGYAQFFYQFPLGVFGIAIATAIFPLLSREAAADDGKGLQAALTRGLRLSLLLALPASVGLCLVATPLVRALLEYGAFDPARTDRVAGALVLYTLGLPAYFVQHLLVRTYYALGDSRTPARIGASVVAVNLALNLMLVGALEERGIALATATCAWLQLAWQVHALRERLPSLRLVSIAGSLARIAGATLIMGVVLWFADEWLPASLAERRVVHLTVLVVVGVAVFTIAARALRVSELGLALRRSHKTTS